MTTPSKITLAVASLALVLMYVFPIWKITLDAPQYPEGIGMYIWIDTITGVKPNDLQNINGLNHYIGMKTIVPDAIPELRVMPWVIGLLIGLGLVAAGTGRRGLLYTWAGVFLAAAVVGLVDFYLWAYDYGHNLDPTAAIKIPGMTYQPPLIGSKQLLNFTANSWPALGGWAAFAALAAGLALIVVPRLRRPRAERSAPAKPLLVAAVLLLLAGCSPAPEPLVHGRDACVHCKMTLADEQYGAELVMATGKVFRFDSVECMAAHELEQEIEPTAVHSRWVVDFQNPPHLVAASEAFFLHSKDLRSPMGMYLTSFGPAITPQAVSHSFYGTIVDWDGVLDVVRERRMPPGAETLAPVHTP